MNPHAPHSLLAPIHRLLADERRRQATDGDLLRAFVQQGEQAAFAELLRRHGPMVLRLALHLLHHRQDAEDVFQATFLTLARKAHSLRNECCVAAWLHRVAWRLSLRSRAAQRRTAGVSRLVTTYQQAEADPADEIRLREAQALLHQELAALPESLRQPLVLCYLQGRTRDEAARRLDWSLGTLKRRLEQGRKLLHARLSRRGVALSAVLSASLLASAEVSASLAAGTLGLAASCVAGSMTTLPASVAALLKASSSVKVKALWGLVLMLGACVGTGAWVYRQGGEPAAPPYAPPVNNLRAVNEDAKPPASARDHFGDPLPPGALARMGTVRFRHGDRIEGISLSPDGRTLAAASSDRTVRLWDMATGQEIRRLPGHEGSGDFGFLCFVAFSPNGKILATGVSPSGIVRLWDAATGKELRKLQEPKGWVDHLTFSPDGKMVAAGADQHRIAVWDVASGRLLHTLDGAEDKLTFAVPIAFSTDGRLLASGGRGEILRLWDLKTGKEQRRFAVPQPSAKENSDSHSDSGRVRAVAFSPDGRILASASGDSPVRLWEVATGKEIRALRGDRYGANTLAFSSDGKTLASGEGSGTIRVWETATGKEVRRIQAHSSWVSGVAFLRDGKTLVTSGGSAIRLWDICSGAEISPDRGHAARIISSVLAADGRTLITGSVDGDSRWWDVATGKEFRRIACLTESPLWSLGAMALSPDGAMVAYKTQKPAGGKDIREVHVGFELWDLTVRKKRPLLWRPNASAANFSPDGKTLYTRIWDVKQRTHFLIAWDTATGRELRSQTTNTAGHEEGLILSTDGKLLAGTAQGQTPTGVEKSIYVRDVVTGKELCRVPASLEFDPYLAISPDNRLLAAADGPRWRPDSRVVSQHIQLWDIATGKEISQFGEAGCGYWAVAFSSDGKTLATAAQDNRIRLWEAATGGERLRLLGHAGQIGKLIFAENDRTLISTSSDTTALVWDLTGLRRPIRPANREQSFRSLQELWKPLTDKDAARAYRVTCRLIATPADTLVLLRRHLKPIEAVDEKRIERLIADLDADVFTVREKAMKELRKVGELAEPALRKALASKPTVEMRRRLQSLLAESDERQSQLAPELLRQLRAVEVLERIGTPEAQRLLESLAGGATGARLTQEARAAVQRLKAHPGAKP